MPTEDDSERDSAFEMTPPIVCNYPDDVAEVHDVGDLRVRVWFNDGTTGIVDVSAMVESPDAGVCGTAESRSFCGAHVHYGAVTRPGEIVLAPNAMYDALRKNGEWILD